MLLPASRILSLKKSNVFIYYYTILQILLFKNNSNIKSIIHKHNETVI